MQARRAKGYFMAKTSESMSEDDKSNRIYFQLPPEYWDASQDQKELYLESLLRPLFPDSTEIEK